MAKMFSLSRSVGILCGGLAMLAIDAKADMSTTDMAQATDVVRVVAQGAVQYEVCGVNSTQAIVMVLKWASGACKASEGQLSKLQKAYDDEVQNHLKTLKTEGGKCTWSLTEAQSNFDGKFLGAIKQKTAGPC